MNRNAWIWITIAAVGLMVAMAEPALAQDGPPTRTLGDNILASFPVGLFIIALSVASLGLAIEHFVNVRRDKIIPPEVHQELELLFDDEDYEGALQYCESTPGFVTNVVAAALPRMSQGFDAMQQAMLLVGDEEAVKLQLKVSFLSLIAALGPMLGLFGTVTGMVDAFNVIASSAGGANPQDLADGISMALMTTVLGLIVAIPSTAFYFYFKNKATKIILEAGVVCSLLIDRFRPVEA